MPRDDQIIVTFPSVEARDRWRWLCQQLGHDEHQFAARLLNNFIGYCEETRPKEAYSGRSEAVGS